MIHTHNTQHIRFYTEKWEIHGWNEAFARSTDHDIITRSSFFCQFLLAWRNLGRRKIIFLQATHCMKLNTDERFA